MERNGNNFKRRESFIENKPIPINIINQVLKSICKIIIKEDNQDTYGTGFFINVSDSKKYLCTNNHIISKEVINKNIYIELNNHKRKKLEVNDRDIKYFPRPKDITIIEIKKSDKIYKYIEFLNIDMNYKNGYEIYKDSDIFSIEYPLGKIANYASGKIIEIVDKEFSHTIPTNNGASGCPIILLNDDINLIQVIGIHKSSSIGKEINYGTFIGEIFKLDNTEKNILMKNVIIDLNLIKNISAIKITYLFRKLLKSKREAYHKLYKCFTQIPVSEYKIDLNNSYKNVNLAPENICLYLGTSFNNQKDGLGLEVFNNSNAKYFGIFRNGKRKEAGIFKINNNLKNYSYYGFVKGIYASGYGLQINKKEKKEYEGMWLNSMKNGYGIEKYNDNSEYRGCFLNGKKEGIGTYRKNDNSSYEGEWKENKYNGFGIYKFSDGSQYKGEFKNNKYNGFGEFTYFGLKRYYGFYKDNEKNGFGIEIWLKEKRIFIGFWKNNYIDGFGKLFDNKITHCGIWKKAELVEPFKKREFIKRIKSEHKNYLIYFKLDNYNDVIDVMKHII